MIRVPSAVRRPEIASGSIRISFDGVMIGMFSRCCFNNKHHLKEKNSPLWPLFYYPAQLLILTLKTEAVNNKKNILFLTWSWKISFLSSLFPWWCWILGLSPLDVWTSITCWPKHFLPPVDEGESPRSSILTSKRRREASGLGGRGVLRCLATSLQTFSLSLVVTWMRLKLEHGFTRSCQRLLICFRNFKDHFLKILMLGCQQSGWQVLTHRLREGGILFTDSKIFISLHFDLNADSKKKSKNGTELICVGPCHQRLLWHHSYKAEVPLWSDGFEAWRAHVMVHSDIRGVKRSDEGLKILWWCIQALKVTSVSKEIRLKPTSLIGSGPEGDFYETLLQDLEK